MKKSFRNVSVIIFCFAVLRLIVSCSSDNPSNKSGDKPSEYLSNFYVIEKADVERPKNKNVWIYVSDTSKLTDINEELKKQYNGDKENYVSFYYFNKKGISKIDVMKAEKAQLDEYDKHNIGGYTFNPSNNYEEFVKDYKDKDWK